ncbi:phosphatase PAP2 family protein [uncultured Dysosmobacter sp.]|uniref:phosphatase PAP2 family protein n=1 Tax=uncultured Dysosmobacter sp. TaxID=2591384 RepID=UPI0026092143|nr:phosphatase PAP2 family protein [uncultured Dysosmobacter sp.]
MRPSLSVPWRDLKYALWLPVYLASFLLLEQLVDGSHGYWATQLPLDRLIPFQELFVVPYCLWYPLLVVVGLYLLLRDGNAFRRYMCFLAVSFFLSELIWLLIPNGQDLRPLVMPRDNLFTRWVAGLYSIDTNTNVFPSVHVVGSIGAALAVWDGFRRKPVLRWGTTVLAVLICLSTLFIKQHAVLDVAGGAVLSALVALPIYRRVPLTAFRLRRRSQPLENPE